MAQTSTRTGLSRLTNALVANPDFVAVAIFCAIGVLLTLDVVLRAPMLVAFAN